MPDVKKYTHAQVKEHNNENDVWLIINDKVYDVTKFLKEVGFSSTDFILFGQTISIHLYHFSILVVRRF